MNTVLVWLLSFMTTMAPLDRPQFYPDAKETRDQAQARYESIAKDIHTVLWNQPALFTGPDGRAKTAAVMMSIMLHESAFRRDVDFGLGSAGRGDGGRSWCLMQIQVGQNKTATWNAKYNRFKQWGDAPEDLVQGWTGDEMVKDRKKCIEAGYRIMKASFEMCKSLPVDQWLDVYAAGSCGSGVPQSRVRMNTGINWFNGHAPTFTDAQALQLLAGYKTTPSTDSALADNP